MLEFTKKRTWQRAHTSKRYLQPPFCGYLCTQWPDFKLVLSKLYTKDLPRLNYQACKASGVLLLFGEALCAADFHQTKMIPRLDGYPIHFMTGKADGLEISMENFCTPDSPQTMIYAKITISNPQDHAKDVKLALLPRTGREDHLTGMATDGYMHYNGNQKNFGFIPRTFSYCEGKIFDEDCVIKLQDTEDFSLRWVEDEAERPWDQRGILELKTVLKPKQEKSFVFCLKPAGFDAKISDYASQKERTQSFWEGELRRLKRTPNVFEQVLVNNIITQLLQFFAYYEDDDVIAPRQGGMNRFTWPAEAMDFLEPLEELGDFSEYVEKALSFYFDHCQTKEGEDCGRVVVPTGWASSTGAAVYSAAVHILQNGNEEYLRWKEPMYQGFLWMEDQRKKSFDCDCEGKGIFPPCRGTDWPGEFQSWCMTDTYNLLGYEKMALAFEKMNDPRSAQIRAAYEDYLACEKKILHQVVEKNVKNEQLLIPNRLGCEQTDPPTGAYLIDGPAALLRANVIDANSDEARNCENYFRDRGLFCNGLTGLMTDGLMRAHSLCDPWAGHTWYTSMGDYCWFLTWLKQGRRDEAVAVLNANMQFGVSDACYLAERYADNDPYFTPWQPNASANGRMLSMMMQIYGTREL